MFDTNVLISAALNNNSTSGLSIKKVLEQNGYLIFSDDTFGEFSEVIKRKKLEKYWAAEKRIKFIEYILGASHFFEPKIQVNICSDPKDNMFLSLALECQANCIVSGDKHLLELHPFEHIPILTPADFTTHFII